MVRFLQERQQGHAHSAQHGAGRRCLPELTQMVILTSPSHMAALPCVSYKEGALSAAHFTDVDIGSGRKNNLLKAPQLVGCRKHTKCLQMGSRSAFAKGTLGA